MVMFLTKLALVVLWFLGSFLVFSNAKKLQPTMETALPSVEVNGKIIVIQPDWFRWGSIGLWIALYFAVVAFIIFAKAS